MIKLITEQQRIESFRSASDQIKGIYSSDLLYGLVEAISTRSNLSSEQFKTLLALVGDTVLGIYTSSGFLDIIYSEFGVDVKSDDVQKLYKFLYPESISKVSEVISIRTIESDVDKVQGYGAYRELYPDERLIGNEEFTHQSSQDDALARPKMADLPSYKQGE